MLKNVLVLLCGVMLSSAAFAQDYGVLIGVHQTEASDAPDGVSTDSVLNFKAGLAANFELTDAGVFRTGVLYNQRNFDAKAGNVTAEFKLAYLDIPALYQHKLTDMFSVFGGMVIGVNVADDVELQGGGLELDPETLIPLLSAGVNLTFNDQYGFDFYFERGLGDATGVKGGTAKYGEFTTFGANFLYLF